MLVPVASLLLSLGAAAFISRGGRPAWVGVLAAAFALLAASLEWGIGFGLLVALFLAMTSCSAMVLLMPVRPTWAPVLGSVFTTLGLAALGLGALL